MIRNRLAIFAAAASLLVAGGAQAVQLVQTLDPGYYNSNLGTVLNGTSAAFPGPGDPSLDFGPGDAPDLSAAASLLGGWLNQPAPDLSNGSWSANPISIPNGWAVNTEVAIVYVFDTGGATNVVGEFGVDNGIFVWLDGVFIGGALRGGGVSLGEHTFDIGDLAAGTHYLQLLLEDHGATNGYAVSITADEFLPPLPTPAPAGLALFGLGLLGAALLCRRRR